LPNAPARAAPAAVIDLAALRAAGEVVEDRELADYEEAQ
jgi:hypothetical protein